MDASRDAALARLIAEQPHGVLVTQRANGRPHLSNVSHTFDPGAGLIRVSITTSRVKAKNLARDPRASYHVTSDDFWHWAVADCAAELTPVARDPHDATVDELVEVYRAIGGEHPDWAEYRAAMVRDGRLVARLHVQHLYGQP